jgi:hypothetical protein
MFNTTFFESGYDFVSDQLNINIGTGGAALTGVWISVRNYERAYCLILNPAGSAGDDIVITPLQATSAAGGGSKALTFSRMWVKAGATAVLTNTIGTWVQYDLTTPSSALNFNSVVGNITSANGSAPVAIATTDLGLETIENIVLVEFRADSLDITNGFCFLSMTIPAVGSAATKTINSHWIMAHAEYPQALPLSVLA